MKIQIETNQIVNQIAANQDVRTEVEVPGAEENPLIKEVMGMIVPLPAKPDPVDADAPDGGPGEAVEAGIEI